MRCVAFIRTSSLPKKDVPKKHHKTLEPRLEFPHPQNQSAGVPITLDQWLSSRDGCVPQGTLGSVRRHFWLSQWGELDVQLASGG